MPVRHPYGIDGGGIKITVLKEGEVLFGTQDLGLTVEEIDGTVDFGFEYISTKPQAVADEYLRISSDGANNPAQRKKFGKMHKELLDMLLGFYAK